MVLRQRFRCGTKLTSNGFLRDFWTTLSICNTITTQGLRKAQSTHIVMQFCGSISEGENGMSKKDIVKLVLIGLLMLGAFAYLCCHETGMCKPDCDDLPCIYTSFGSVDNS